MPKLPRRERERLRHRREILRAAETIFSQQGFHDATIQEIAAQAEFAVGTIYQHFESKEVLFQSLFDELVEELTQQIRHAIAAEEAWSDKLRAFVRTHLLYHQRKQSLLRIYVLETGGFQHKIKSALGDKLFQHYQTYLASVRELFEAGLAGGLLKPFDPMQLALALVGMLNSFLAHWLQTGGHERLTDYEAVILDMFLRGALLEDVGRHRPSTEH